MHKYKENKKKTDIRNGDKKKKIKRSEQNNMNKK